MKYDAILALKEKGYTGAEVKEILNLSLTTHHINRIYRQFGGGGANRFEQKLQEENALLKKELQELKYEVITVKRYTGLRAWCTANRKKPDYSREVTIYA